MSKQTKSQSGVGRFAREQPLLMAVLCIAFGVALGCALRMTPEDMEFLGEKADRLKERANKFKDSASDLAADGYDKAKQFAERAAHAAADTIKGTAEKAGAEGGRQEGRADVDTDDVRPTY